MDADTNIFVILFCLQTSQNYLNAISMHLAYSAFTGVGWDAVSLAQVFVAEIFALVAQKDR